MANTMTNRVFLNEIIKANISDEVTKFAKAQIEKLDKRNDDRKKNGTKAQQENAGIKTAIYDTMEDGVTYTAANIATMGIEGVPSTQKASSLLRQLVAEGKVTETEVPIKVSGKGTRKVKGYTRAPEIVPDDDEAIAEIVED